MEHSHDYRQEAYRLYITPFMELLFKAHGVHREHHNPLDVQRCALLSIKTGGCPEDCAYCPQSAHHKTESPTAPLLSLAEVRAAIARAKDQGADRFCMGAAWRNPKDGPAFDQVLGMIREVKRAGMEACVTLGMLTENQAERLKEAGLDAYNHNLDTSPEYYAQIISTRTYQDRLETLAAVSRAGISVCSGGIIGMGETAADRCAMIAELAKLQPQPESVPINLLIRWKARR